jgi:hypothetical protein
MRINGLQVNTYYQSQSLFTNASVSTGDSSTDALEISEAGRGLGKMMRRDGNHKAHRAAMQEAISELDINDLKVSELSDEEIRDVLTDFESKMGDHMHEGYTPASEMSSEELKASLSRLQGIDKQDGNYDRPMRPKGPKPPKGGLEIGTDNNMISSFLELLENSEESVEETSDSDMVELLTNYQSMESILAYLSK